MIMVQYILLIADMQIKHNKGIEQGYLIGSKIELNFQNQLKKEQKI